jgi:hypothetical protein
MANQEKGRWVISHFAQSNPRGPGQGNVPSLLRRVADSIENLGNVDVHDICFHSQPTSDEDELTIVVYYVEAEH